MNTYHGEAADVKYDLSGTVRSRRPEQTLEILTKLLPRYGITRVANITHLDTIGIPTAVSVRPNAKHLSTAQGKGVTQALASISSIMEAIEGYHAENARSPDVFGRFDKLSRRNLILDPRELPLGMRWKRFQVDREMGWSWGCSLFTEEPVLVPSIFTTMDSSNWHEDWAICDATTNGLASGNNRYEALAHSLYEIIERECEYRWNDLADGQRNRTLLANESIDTPFIQDLLSCFERANVDALIWDMTCDLNVPAYRCVIVNKDPFRPLGRYHGSGAHLNKNIALARALTEAAQARLTWIHGAREDVFGVFYEEQRRIRESPLAMPLGTVDFKERQTPFEGTTFCDDVSWVLRSLETHGFRKVVSFSHTDECSPISVVLGMVPGMRFSGNR